MKRTVTILASVFFASIIFILAGCGGGTSAPPPPTTVTAAPTGVTATPADSKVTISWTTVAGATSYNIYWSTTAGVTIGGTGVSKIMNATDPFVQPGLTNGTTYFYIVTAVNSIGESAPSNEVSATPAVAAPTAPAAPTGVTATAGITQVTINWTAVTGATSYNIYRSTTSPVTIGGTGVTQIAGVASPHIDTPLTAGTTYFYIVTAVNSAGESNASSQVSAVPTAGPPAGGPATPTGVAATGGLTNSVRINWTAVAGATSYNIYRGTATGVTTTSGTKIPVAGGTTATFLDSDGLGVGLAANTKYFYIMTAVNASGESLPSTEVNATTQALDGVALYTVNCANQSCHAHGTTLANSSFKPGGRTAAQITSAISTVSAMNFLSTLTSAQIQAIADVLTF